MKVAFAALVFLVAVLAFPCYCEQEGLLKAVDLAHRTEVLEDAAIVNSAVDEETSVFDEEGQAKDGSENLKEITEADDVIDEADEKFVNSLGNWIQFRDPSARRRRRWVGLAVRGAGWAFKAARGLFRGAHRTGITRSGSRLTRQYTKSGSYRSGLRDFARLKPDNVKRISGGYTRGYTGTVGRYRVTVRNASKGRGGTRGPPTLEIRRGTSVRKFRYRG